MSHTTKPQRPAARSVENPSANIVTPVSGDRLLDRTETNRLLGLKGHTSHTLRAMASRGQLEAVRINSRVLRFRESSVLRLIDGRAA